MAKDKSLGSNPALDFHKKAKKAGINKSKAEKAKLRDTQLQKRRPDQVQRQIDELRQLAQAGKINAQDKKNLEALERDLARINKLRVEGKTGPVVTSERIVKQDAREERKREKIPKDPTRSYYYDPVFNPYGVPPPGMPYREIDVAAVESDSSTTSSILRIPLPPGSPPPLKVTMVPEAMSKGSRDLSTDASRVQNTRQNHAPGRMAPTTSQNEDTDTSEIKEAPRPVQTSYSAEPVMKDLRKEALAFVPKNLKRKSAAMQKQRQVDPLDVEAMEEQELAKQVPIQKSTQTLHQPAQLARKRINAAPDV